MIWHGYYIIFHTEHYGAMFVAMCGKAGWFVRGREYGAGLLQLDESNGFEGKCGGMDRTNTGDPSPLRILIGIVFSAKRF
jgi:hypothetical protein